MLKFIKLLVYDSYSTSAADNTGLSKMCLWMARSRSLGKKTDGAINNSEMKHNKHTLEE